MKAKLRRLLDILLWIAFLIYLPGGVRWGGRLHLTYMHDLWAACALVYVFARLFFDVRFHSTSFGKAFISALEASIQFVRTWRLNAFRDLTALAWLIGGAGVYSFILYFVLPSLSYHSFGNYIFDLGVIENAIYGMAKTGRLGTYYLSANGITPFMYVPDNRLNFGLIFFGWMYRLFPSTELVLFIQSLALMLSVIPLYKLGEMILPREIPRWAPVLLLLFWDPLYRINIWDLHETPFNLFFGLWAFYFIEKGRFYRAIIFMLLMAIWREDAWWTFAGMSIYLGIRSRRWVISSALAVSGASVFLLHVLYWNKVNSISGRYPSLGDNLHQIIWTLVSRPWTVFQIIWINSAFFSRLLLCFGAGGFLFAGWAILPALPGIAEIGLSQHEGMLSWLNHYVGVFAAPLFFATLHGWARIWVKLGKRPNLVRYQNAFIGCSLAICLSQLSFSLTGAFRMGINRFHDTRCFENLIRQIPAEVPVLAVNPVAARLSKREWIMAPDPGSDQSRAQWLIAADTEALQAGMHGKSPVKPWKVVDRQCGLYVAMRSPDGP